jgi:hypothetical protein
LAQRDGEQQRTEDRVNAVIAGAAENTWDFLLLLRNGPHFEPITGRLVFPNNYHPTFDEITRDLAGNETSDYVQSLKESYPKFYDAGYYGAAVAPLLFGRPSAGLGKVVGLGKAGEAAVGLPKNTVRIKSLTGTANYRIPDHLSKDALVMSEVKNVSKIGATSQLNDMAAWASVKGYKFDLYIRTTTELSGPLLKMVKEGLIKLGTSGSK